MHNGDYLIVVRRVSHVKYGVTFIQMRSVSVSDTSVNNDMKFLLRQIFGSKIPSW